MGEKEFSRIKELLDGKQLGYKVMVHEPVHTSEEAAKIRGVDLKQGAKAMVLRSEGKFYQFVIAGDKKIDFKKIKRILNSTSASFAMPEEVENVTGCVIGSVPPFGNLFNIPVYVDKSLLRNEVIDFNAGLRTHSLQMKLEDYLKAVNGVVEDFAATDSSIPGTFLL